MKSVFEYDDYKAFVMDRIDSLPNHGRGARKRLANFIGCQNTFISHVLSGDYHFSLEQAERAARFFQLSTEQSEYFLNLVSLNRSGTRELSSFLKGCMSRQRERDLSLKDRLKIRTSIKGEDQAIYLSHWYYAIIHGALSIPELQSSEAIVQRLGLNRDIVDQVIEFLLSRGFAKIAKGRVVSSDKEIHFPRESPFLSQLHRNFRQMAINAIDRNRDEDLHYSGVVFCSRDDVARVKALLTKALEDALAVVRVSPEEELVALNVDWFVV